MTLDELLYDLQELKDEGLCDGNEETYLSVTIHPHPSARLEAISPVSKAVCHIPPTKKGKAMRKVRIWGVADERR